MTKKNYCQPRTNVKVIDLRDMLLQDGSGYIGATRIRQAPESQVHDQKWEDNEKDEDNVKK